jgi:DNA-binding GntR family transcriptional regulator
MKRAGAAPKRQQNTVIYDCVERLRNAIMVGELRPGQKLIEANLCETMAVSRPSLREALRVLEADGLIELFPNRGPSVARLGDREIEEIHDVWAMLTGEAVYRFAKAANANDIREVEHLINRLKTASRADDLIAMLTWTNGIFGTIFAKCDNNLLIDMVYSLVARINFLRAQSLADKGWRRQWVAEIEDMIATIRTGTPSAARETVRNHIASACNTAKRVGPLPKPARIPKSKLLIATSALVGGAPE